ncbi:MAG: TIGR04282 family arsenosugar biosynthesis glycosyltransferase [Desulfobaccales bacterium]|nr:TIGR04282 family arsenosugar biosynthesis glycosyltransferase [Desulfobaccales bacterium]
MTTLLIIFAKEPVPGQVKTRFSPNLSPEGAAELYCCFLEDILEEVVRWPQLRLALAYTPPESLPFFQGLVPSGTDLFPQEGADLGERMARAFDRGFGAGYEAVLLRGSDSPDLPGNLLLEAKNVLQAGKAEVVLGSCPDGGYYLVGLKAPQPELFRGQAWSTATVLSQTLARAQSLSLKAHLLSTWPDIDTYTDLLGFLARPHPAPLPGWRSHVKARELLTLTV